MHDTIGRTVIDKITGFRGRVTGRCEYITGCNQLLVHPGIKPDGSMRDPVWIDEQRCEITGRMTDKIVMDNGASPGPDKAAPAKR